MTKNEIYSALMQMRAENEAAATKLPEATDITRFTHLVRRVNGLDVWTDAINAAINECSCVVIPPRDEPYYIDGSIVVCSDRLIDATGAHIKLLETSNNVIMHNKSIANGTLAPITLAPDRNITVRGGIWEEAPRSTRIGGKIEGFGGVATSFYFGNIQGLTLTDCTFVNASCFSVQVGNITNGVFERLYFKNGIADGLHVSGNCRNIYIYDLSGTVGDDLLALNMYDWLNSSVNFGPTSCLWAEKLTLSPQSPYKALRILPGTYYYADGSSIDCSLTDCVIKNVRGVSTYKFYFQTPAYDFEHELPEPGTAGTVDNVYFEDIVADLTGPIDRLDNYVNSDPVTGTIAVFELGSEIGKLYLNNIDVTLHRDEYPESYLLSIGPKTSRIGNKEVFNPDAVSFIKRLTLSNVRINGQAVSSADGVVREIVFDDLYGDGKSSGKGTVEKLIVE